MEITENEKEVLDVLTLNNYLFLVDLIISESLPINPTSLKNSLNRFIFKAMDMGISNDKIEILIAAGDIIDYYSDQTSAGDYEY